MNQLLKQENISQSKKLKIPMVPISTLQAQLMAVQATLSNNNLQTPLIIIECHHPVGIALGSVALIDLHFK